MKVTDGEMKVMKEAIKEAREMLEEMDEKYIKSTLDACDQAELLAKLREMAILLNIAKDWGDAE